MRFFSGLRIALLQLAVVLLALPPAYGQVDRKSGHSATELKYFRDLRECAALASRSPLVELAHHAIDPAMNFAGSAMPPCPPDGAGGACAAPRTGDGEAAQLLAIDIRVLKINSYRLACMGSKGWQQTLADDLRSKRNTDSQVLPEARWEWGNQAFGKSCRSHQECAENLYCRDEVCVSFMNTPWGGMGAGDSCSVYYDCSLGLLCRKGLCVPAGAEISGSLLLPGSRAKGKQCTDHYQCGTGLLCRAQVCTPAAAVALEPVGEKSGGASCTAHYQCAKALLCVSGSCN